MKQREEDKKTKIITLQSIQFYRNVNKIYGRRRDKLNEIYYK